MGGEPRLRSCKHHMNVDFAIVLLTPEDVGAPNDNSDELIPRPSQDTIFELAYFLSELRPDQVCTLYKRGVELPSYIDSRIHIPIGSSDGWKLKLVQEMRYAELPIDPNRLLL